MSIIRLQFPPQPPGVISRTVFGSVTDNEYTISAIGQVDVDTADLNGFLAMGAGPVANATYILSQGDLRVTIILFGAIADGTTDAIDAIEAALASPATIIVAPAGEYYVSRGFNVPSGKEFTGDGMYGTTLRWPSGQGGISLDDDAAVSNITLDGTTIDDVAGGAGVVFGKVVDHVPFSCNNGRAINVRCTNWGFHGFATRTTGVQDSGCTNCSIINCIADGAGHRGINFSAGARNNTIVGFRGLNCWKAGIIFGYLTRENVVSNVYLEGYRQSDGGSGLWVSNNSYNNAFSNFVIGPANANGGAHEPPAVLLQHGASRNTFTNFTINNEGFRSVYLDNTPPDHPELGTFLSDMADNVFSDFTIIGDSAAGTSGILFYEDTMGGDDGVRSFGAITGGAAYTAGTFYDVPLTGGTGSGAQAKIITAGGAVTSVTMSAPGTLYTAGDTLSASAADIGGTGAGFSIPVATVGDIPTYTITRNIFSNFTMVNLDLGIAEVSGASLHIQGINTFSNFRFNNVNTPLPTTAFVNSQRFLNCDTTASNMRSLYSTTVFGANYGVPSLAAVNPEVQIADSTARFAMSINRFTADSSGGNIAFFKSRSATYRNLTPPVSGDILGNIRFTSNDGATPLGCVTIQAQADGTQVAGSTPGKLVILCTPSASTTPVEVLRIDNDGVGSTGGGGTRIFNQAAICTRGYAKASLPSATPAGQIIYVTDEAGGAVLAFADGTDWRRVTDRAVVS